VGARESGMTAMNKISYVFSAFLLAVMLMPMNSPAMQGGPIGGKSVIASSYSYLNGKVVSYKDRVLVTDVGTYNVSALVWVEDKRKRSGKGPKDQVKLQFSNGKLIKVIFY
jgi:hypothetical protein